MTAAAVRYREIAWQDHAACRGHDPEMFFPRARDAMMRRAAKRICGACPVRAECLGYSQRHQIPFGIYGGKTGRQRLRLRSAGDGG